MKCERCPVKLGPCVGERASHAFACKMAAGGGAAELRWVVDESMGSPAVPTLAATAGPPVRHAVSHAELRNATRLGSKNCWFAEHAPGCGCDGLSCHLLGRRISIYDCVQCLEKW
jgi:hypothetical protein